MHQHTAHFGLCLHEETVMQHSQALLQAAPVLRCCACCPAAVAMQHSRTCQHSSLGCCCRGCMVAVSKQLVPCCQVLLAHSCRPAQHRDSLLYMLQLPLLQLRLLLLCFCACSCRLVCASYSTLLLPLLLHCCHDAACGLCIHSSSLQL
jgi:hypothetical protein